MGAFEYTALDNGGRERKGILEGDRSRAKKQRHTRKKAHTVDIKGIRMRPGMEAHDFDVRLRATQRFLEEGHKVQATLIFRGREHQHSEIGRALLDKLATGVSDVGQVERPPFLEGRRMSMLLAPK